MVEKLPKLFADLIVLLKLVCDGLIDLRVDLGFKALLQVYVGFERFLKPLPQAAYLCVKRVYSLLMGDSGLVSLFDLTFEKFQLVLVDLICEDLVLTDDYLSELCLFG